MISLYCVRCGSRPRDDTSDPRMRRRCKCKIERGNIGWWVGDLPRPWKVAR